MQASQEVLEAQGGQEDLEQRVYLVQVVVLAHLVSKVLLVTQEAPEAPAHKVLLDQQVSLVHLDSPVAQDQ